MTTLQKINSLSWFDLITKLKDVLKSIVTTVPTPIDSRPYKVYTALVTENGILNPIVKVLENTLGVVSINYQSPGQYSIVTNGLLTLNKTYATVSPAYPSTNGYYLTTGAPGSGLRFYRTPAVVVGGIDELLNDTPIEIRVYN